MNDLTRKPQTHSTNREGQLKHLSATRLEDPVESYSEQEEGDEVEGFVGLLVGGDFVVGGGESRESCECAEGEECACRLF